MRKAAIIVILLTIISKFFGFGRDIVLAYIYGASNVSDAYLISQTIPAVIFALIGNGILTSYIPIYSNISNENGKEKADLFTSNIINLTLIVCIILAIMVVVFNDFIIRLFASGFEDITFDLARKLTIIGIFSIVFSGVFYILTGYLQIKKNFFAPALMGIPLNLILILSVFISKYSNILFLSIGSVLAAMFQLLFLLFFARKEGYHHAMVIRFKDAHTINFLHLSIPVILGVSVDQINLLVDRTLASHIVIGGISSLTYANRFNLFIQGIFATAIATVMYPLISKMVANNNIKGLKKTLSSSISILNLLLIPIIIGTMLFSKPIVKLLFEHGAFDSQSLLLTSSALFYYSIGMLGYGLREILSRAFYSMQDTRTPMINAAIGMGLNIILNLILSKHMGINGLALATSISAIFITGLLFVNLRKKIGSFGINRIASSFLKILSASLIMGSLALKSFNVMTYNKISQNISFLLVIAIGSVSYILIIYFMKIDEVDDILSIIKRKLNRSFI